MMDCSMQHGSSTVSRISTNNNRLFVQSHPLSQQANQCPTHWQKMCVTSLDPILSFSVLRLYLVSIFFVVHSLAFDD